MVICKMKDRMTHKGNTAVTQWRICEKEYTSLDISESWKRISQGERETMEGDASVC